MGMPANLAVSPLTQVAAAAAVGLGIHLDCSGPACSLGFRTGTSKGDAGPGGWEGRRLLVSRLPICE